MRDMKMILTLSKDQKKKLLEFDYGLPPEDSNISGLSSITAGGTRNFPVGVCGDWRAERRA